MHEFLFADAARPSDRVVLKLLMRPYSVGHELLLLKQRNPLLSPSFDALLESRKREAVLQAANVCNQTWAENLFTPGTWWEKRRYRRNWEKWDLAVQDVDWETEIMAMRDYMSKGSLGPPIEVADGPAGRAPGAPFHAGLIQFLINTLRLPHVEVCDYPFGLAKFHYYTHAEAQGAIKIINLAEYEFEDFCRREDAKAEQLKFQVGDETKGGS
jgi:hypothetical protein